MRNTRPRRLHVYRTQNGRRPFAEWLESIQDKRTQSRIQTRLDRLEAGNLGDCHAVGEGVLELRLHFGAGYRIYFGEVGNTIVLLVLATSHHKRRILNVRRTIGCNIRRHTDERISNMARVPN